MMNAAATPPIINRTPTTRKMPSYREVPVFSFIWATSFLNCSRCCSGNIVHPKVGGRELLFDRVGASDVHDATVEHDGCRVGDGQDGAGELLGDQDRNTRGRQFPHRVVHL